MADVDACHTVETRRTHAPRRWRKLGGRPRPAERTTRLPPPHHHVLPSLKARQAVQTCVLSTRWRHLWRSVPCLDVDIDEFRTKAATPVSSSGGSDSSSDSDDSDSDSGNNQDKGEGWDEFEDFSVNLMLRCNIALLDSFRLDIDRGSEPLFYGCSSSRAALGSWAYSGRQAAAWLRRAMKYCTPGSVCRSLEDLELDHCICEIRSIASDSLKNLILKRSCGADSSLTLKTLVINGGSNENRNLLAISAPMVVDLHLDVHGGCFRGGAREFQNLRNLLLDDCDLSDDFRILRFFHQGSPNLEKLPGDSEDKEGTCKLDKTSSSGCCCGLDFLPLVENRPLILGQNGL
ncbi:MEIOTIC F-BOX protein MOF-like [Miscanthus floridulus]|uniref:MEIOTIC F-BOX protein MOF-like n=1 Tax=Miscanthus floridulus TaxID=154761 RepID=UPI00345ABC29